ncbi:MAG: TolB family protein [Terriglobales bacterium]
MRMLLIIAMALLQTPDKATQFPGLPELTAFSKSADTELLAYYSNANVVLLMKKGESVPLALETRMSEIKGCCAHRATPALSHRGERIAYVHVLAGTPRREAIAVLDVAAGKSVDVFESEAVWSVAWSPDDSQLAAVADGEPAQGRSIYIIVPQAGRSAERLHFALDIKGVEYQVSNYSTPSWDPGGKRLALEFRRRGLGASNSSAGAIGVVDLESKAVKELAEGVEPSWSPAGDEVAYFARNRKSCVAIRESTGEKRLLFTVGQQGAGRGRGPLFFPVVWSPDGKQLLFHQWVDPDLVTDIYKLDLAIGRSRKVGRSEVQVVSWRQAN